MATAATAASTRRPYRDAAFLATTTTSATAIPVIAAITTHAARKMLWSLATTPKPSATGRNSSMLAVLTIDEAPARMFDGIASCR
jgi:hypothetical protein